VGPWFWVGGIQSEQVQVSYYELYYMQVFGSDVYRVKFVE